MADDATVMAEFVRRKSIWEHLVAEGGSPPQLSATELRDCGVVGGQQGIWRNQERTRDLTEQGNGVTVSVMHKAGRYSDEITVDGMDYHYPVTQRPGRTDEAEIDATRSAGELGLPVFIVTDSGAEGRVVQLGAVRGANDSTQRFFIAFLDQWPQTLLPWTLSLQESPAPYGKPLHRRQLFRFKAIEYYGAQCSVCDVKVTDLLDATLLIAQRAPGTDDPRNGLVLCANHRKAFELGLFAIDNDNLSVNFRAGMSAELLGITVQSLVGLAMKPNLAALEWNFKRWKGH